MNKEKAEKGLVLIKEAILRLLDKAPGLRAYEIARELGLESEAPNGSQKGWLCYGFLQVLLCEKKINKIGRKYYISNE